MSNKDLAGVALILAVLAVAGGLFYVRQMLAAKTYDEATLCPTREAGGVRAATLIVIDKSDPFTEPQVATIRQAILTARDALPPGGKIKIAVIEKAPSENAAQIRLLRALCNPGSGETANAIYQNAKLVERRYQERFLEPLDRDLQSLSVPGVAPESPIALALASSINPDDDIAGVAEKRVILVSDLMEHTADASAYKGNFSAESLRRAVGEDAVAWLSGAKVDVHMLQRAKDTQQEAAIATWLAFFQGAGANAAVAKP
jgi:hypothetical protein